MVWLPEKIEQCDPKALRLPAGAPRLHTAEQVELIQRSMRSYGTLAPVVVDDHGQVIAGAARWEAARAMGLAEMPVVRASHLTASEARAFRIVDNAVYDLGQWDADLLHLMLADLGSLGISLADYGFDEPVFTEPFPKAVVITEPAAAAPAPPQQRLQRMAAAAAATAPPAPAPAPSMGYEIVREPEWDTPRRGPATPLTTGTPAPAPASRRARPFELSCPHCGHTWEP